jgi:ssDNA-specific exonuclease RecJ
MTVVLTRKTLDPDLSEIMTKDFITKSFLFFKQNERASLSAFKDTFGIDPIIAGWIIAILIEVGLLTQTDEFFQIVEISEKKDLKNSPTYLKCFELKNDIEKLYSLPTGRLKNHYAKLMEDNHEL